jgi:UDP-N-acetylglucosamine 2-epimerase (non-hydrolysing)/GDP/UDP-N,N'-diacetylbacillosamine 2-epimerase (hydrolysing)
LDAITYWSLLRQVQLMVGNSSSGIMETASFHLPTVNIGLRQQGRERASNVLDAPADTGAILAAVGAARHPDFRASLHGMSNPYGDGVASEKIAEILTSAPLGQKLLMKRAVPLAAGALSEVPFASK